VRIEVGADLGLSRIAIGQVSNSSVRGRARSADGGRGSDEPRITGVLVPELNPEKPGRIPPNTERVIGRMSDSGRETRAGGWSRCRGAWERESGPAVIHCYVSPSEL
jgi:hypothetical protein